MASIFIIGDSNTYGWDPRDMMGGPYKKPWPVFLKEAGHLVAVDAFPGCEIPHAPQLIDEEIKLINDESPDLLIIMLGSNDILNMNEPSAAPALKRMTEFIDKIKSETDSSMQILIMGIPEIRIPGGYREAGAEYNTGIRKIAADKNCKFFNTPDDLPLAYDGVHLTEEAHQILGIYMKKFRELIC